MYSCEACGYSFEKVKDRFDFEEEVLSLDSSIKSGDNQDVQEDKLVELIEMAIEEEKRPISPLLEKVNFRSSSFIYIIII